MKSAVLLLCAALGVVAVFAVPSVGRTPRGEAPRVEADAPAPALEPAAREATPTEPTPIEAHVSGEDVDAGTRSAEACRLVVLRDEHTVVDRGTIHLDPTAHVLEGSYRYQDEPLGRVLYVYDDVQNLVTRIVNPVRVLRYDTLH